LKVTPSRSVVWNWPPLARFLALDARIGAWAEGRGALALGIYEFVRFGLKQGWACLFGGAMLALIVATRLFWPVHAPIARYDALVLGALALQALFLATRLETIEEAKVILIFHVIGTAMELEKTAIGSWIYPEASVIRLAGVPLFTGFMYGSVGSYIARVWRLFDFRFSGHPPQLAIALLSLATYCNFLGDHWLPDIRFALLAATAILFARTHIYYKIHRRYRSMPLLLGFFLVALFIWLAENVGTAMGAWLYPGQLVRWSPVPAAKLASWFLLMIISYTLVAWVNGVSNDGRPKVASAEPAGVRSEDAL
jgi:uncharacterized membrane protein YoaT (DUF817 family)